MNDHMQLIDEINRLRDLLDKKNAEVEQLRDSRIRHLETETKLVAEVERLTWERDEWNLLAKTNAEKIHNLSLKLDIQTDQRAWRARAEAAERKLQQRADELNVLQGSIAAYQTGELERKLAMAVEGVKKIRSLHRHRVLNLFQIDELITELENDDDS